MIKKKIIIFHPYSKLGGADRSLYRLLKKLNKKIHLETSGTQPLSGSFDWICFSPKKFKKPLGIFYKVSD